ncbi:invasion associated locus B family protein [Microvirga terricola]|uniref:invasion associated locus B family protein n=1 Tax=Microvirga terricola TaxID=2719797 RepID=UPI00197C8629|nr:invasion associated locus B family protein [Microvirga terricola]
MILASLQRGFAAGIISAVFLAGTGPDVQAAPAKTPAKTPAKPTAASKTKPAAAGAAAGAAAATAAKPAQAATGPGGAALLASYGDWGVYTAQSGRSKICYALSQPKERLPKNLSRDPAYLFVSFRPAENVKNEVALVLGYAAKDNAPSSAAIGTSSYALLTKATNAWLKNPAEETQAIAAMSKGQNVIVKAQSTRGNQLTDRYSLNGFGQALDRARKECP